MAKFSCIFLLITAQFALGQGRHFKLHQDLTTSDYDAQTIVVKLRSVLPAIARSNSNSNSISQLTGLLNAESYLQAFDRIINAPSAISARSSLAHPLSNIYKIKLRPGQDLEAAINTLLAVDNVEYAEPYYRYQPLFTPNDPLATPNGPQVHLSIVKAFEAWDLEKGDSEMIIAIIDTGIDFDHEDLQENLYTNEGDPINGVDDDGDGLIDNYRGWDFANNDNDPSADFDDHGVRVTGMSSASTDNGVGIAGSGFNTKYMPLKIFASEDNDFFGGFEAIVYAADKGCKVINLSWGDVNPFSQFEQDVINYAVLDKDAVVVAAAGNSNADEVFFPASYDNVLSVASTDNGDQKASFSTFNENVDISAPGSLVFTSFMDNGYNNTSGTSFSSPLVAGAAALLRARSPELSAVQVMEKLRVTSDDITGIAANEPYEGKLGKGRLNMYKALTDNITPSLRKTAFSFSNAFGPYAFGDDTVHISVDIKNFLQPTNNAKVTLTKIDDPNKQNITLIDSIFQIGQLGTLEGTNNVQTPFVIYLDDEVARGEQLLFKLNYKDGLYTDSEFISINTAPDYLTLANGKIGWTVHGEGAMGEDGKPGAMEFFFEGNEIANHIGFFMAQDVTHVASAAAINLASFNRDTDFMTDTPIKRFGNSLADFDARSQFQEVLSPPTGIGVVVEQKVLSWEAAPNNEFVIVEYRLTNVSGATIDDLHVALFANWNLIDNTKNRADWEDPDRLGYVYDQAQSIYSGVALLSEQDPIYNAVDIADENGNAQDLGPSFSKTDKFNLSSNGVDQTTAGEIGDGNDVAHIVGGSLTAFAANESIKVTFALSAGSSLTTLKGNIAAAATRYQEYLDNPPVVLTAYTCENGDAIINPTTGTTFEFYQDPALTTLLHTGEDYTVNNVTTPQSIYIVNKDNPYDGDVGQVIATVKPINAIFSFDNDPFLIDELDTTRVHFLNASINDTEWLWDFGNGFGSTLEQPSLRYQEKGTYTVTLTVKNDIGCEATLSQDLDVLFRSRKPDIPDVDACRNDMVQLSASNATQLQLYATAELATPVLVGNSFDLGPFEKDTLFYVTSFDSTFESNPKEVVISISDILSQFTLDLDTLDIERRHLLNLESQDEEAIAWSWLANGQEFSATAQAQLDYAGLSTLDLALIVTDGLGCSDESQQTIPLKVSPTPSIMPVAICRGDNATLNPLGGSIFYFYDENQQNLLHKGRSFVVEDLQSSQTIYITNVDSLLESEALPFAIDVSSISGDFSQSHDTLNLAEGNIVSFVHNGSEATSWQWEFGNGQTSTLQNPNIEYSLLGPYTITLDVADDIGCVNSSTRELLVVDVTGIEKQDGTLQIFPNPTRGPVTVLTDSNGESRKLEIRNQLGQLLWSELQATTDAAQIDLGHLPAGIYTLIVIVGNEASTQKILIQH